MNKKINKGLREVPKTSVPSDEYRNNYDAIFSKKKQEKRQ